MDGKDRRDRRANDDEVWTVRSPGTWILVIRGEFDIYSSVEIRDQLNEAVSAGISTVLVDLEETTFMDPVGLGVLVDALHLCEQSGTQLRLVAPSEAVLRLLELTSLLNLFEVEQNLAEAYPHVA